MLDYEEDNLKGFYLTEDEMLALKGSTIDLDTTMKDLVSALLTAFVESDFNTEGIKEVIEQRKGVPKKLAVTRVSLSLELTINTFCKDCAVGYSDLIGYLVTYYLIED